MRDIPGYEGLYAVTSCGKVYSYKRQKFLKACGEKDDYQIVWLCKDGEGKSWYVHRLVAMTFLPNPDNLPQVNHKDEHKDHNCLNNLEWCSSKYNLNYGTRTQRVKKPVYCIELDKVYPSIYEAAKSFELNSSNLCSHLSKNCPKTFAGFRWKYSS